MLERTGLIISILLLVAALIRIATLDLYPLTDTTEARYADIGRIMVVTNNWVTPQIDIGKPFMAKPPLSTWLTAISLKLFGINTFAARLPSFLLGLLTLSLLYILAIRLYSRSVARLSVLILASSLLFFVLAGAVMTDPSLGLATTMTTVGVLLALAEPEQRIARRWGYLAFAGIGLGLLAKGPITLVLTGSTVFLWCLFGNHWRLVFERLPWVGGIILLMLIAVPWYVLAELRTPGFLQYFFVGEHFLRFIEPHWSGDLYGAPRTAARGTIWLFWFGATLPWSVLLPVILILRWAGRWPASVLFSTEAQLWRGLLVWWALTPMLFFTFASSVLLAYVYPALPPLALLIALALQPPDAKRPHMAPVVYSLASITPVLFLVLVLIFGPTLGMQRSQLPVLARFQLLADSKQAILAYTYKRPLSADFYGQGRTRDMFHANPSEWRNLLNNGAINFVVVERNRSGHQRGKIPDFVRKRLKPIAEFGEFNEFMLYQERHTEAND